MTGGRLVGLGGSTINAPGITVGSGATFGSAGTVNANLSVSGILSPGASPGTMTVNGNVTLNSGSTALFEITPLRRTSWSSTANWPSLRAARCRLPPRPRSRRARR
jgi:uncharacterized protein with beta-barrel porin domain